MTLGITLQTKLCQIFQIRYPIFLAGMAGGPSTPQLVAAVSNAGGLGTLGAAYLQPEQIRKAIRDIRELTDAPFAVNLFAVNSSNHAIDTSGHNERVMEVQAVLNRMRDELGAPRVPESKPMITPDILEEQFAVVVEEKVPVISTAFGLLPQPFRQAAQSAGMRIVAMATTVKEALLAEQAGCDAVVAQGSEAGGHRGTFDILSQPMGANIGTLALVPQVADQVKIPVIASGGIMDGRGLIAALALGAQGVQMGTRFLTAVESGAHPAYQQALFKSTEESTGLTKSFSGRPARGIKNKFIDSWKQSGAEPLPFPTQNTATRDIRNTAAQQSNPEYMSLWAGQGTRLLKSGQHAREIILETVQQAQALLT